MGTGDLANFSFRISSYPLLQSPATLRIRIFVVAQAAQRGTLQLGNSSTESRMEGQPQLHCPRPAAVRLHSGLILGLTGLSVTHACPFPSVFSFGPLICCCWHWSFNEIVSTGTHVCWDRARSHEEAEFLNRLNPGKNPNVFFKVEANRYTPAPKIGGGRYQRDFRND